MRTVATLVLWTILTVSVAVGQPPAVGQSPAAGEPAMVRVGVADSMVAVRRFAPETQSEQDAGSIVREQPMRVHLAKNEFESAQIVLESPAGRAATDVNVTMGPLVRDGDAQATWPARDISLWQVGQVEVYNLWAPHQNMGWYPDPLLPLVKPFTVQAGERQAVLVRFFASPKSPAGVYRGQMTVSAQGMQETRVPVEITVWDFALPVEQHFTLTIPIWGAQMERMYPNTQTPERRQAYLDMLYDHRVSPIALFEDDIEHAIERGVRDVCLVCFPNDGVAPEKAKQVGEMAARWRDKGWDKVARSFVLLGDETPRDRYPILQEQGKLVREAAPGIARRFTVSPEMIRDVAWIGQELNGAADTLILGISSPSLADPMSQAARKAGLDLWWYYVALHYYIPSAGPEGRMVLWRHWKYQVPGQLHWGMTYWEDANIVGQDGKKWPDVPWDTKVSRGGDGYLVYPAPGGEAFWPSVRLEQLRDGIEDYEYFYRLRELTDQLEKKGVSTATARISENRRLLNLDDALVKTYTEYDKRPEAYRAYRESIAQAIVASQEMIARDR